MANSIAGVSSLGQAASCPSGAVAISGGVRWVGGGDGGHFSMRVLELYPTGSGQGWFTDVYNNGLTTMQVSFHAVCLSGVAQ